MIDNYTLLDKKELIRKIYYFYISLAGIFQEFYNLIDVLDNEDDDTIVDSYNKIVNTNINKIVNIINENIMIQPKDNMNYENSIWFKYTKKKNNIVIHYPSRKICVYDTFNISKKNDKYVINIGNKASSIMINITNINTLREYIPKLKEDIMMLLSLSSINSDIIQKYQNRIIEHYE